MLILEEKGKDKTMSEVPEPSRAWLVMMEQPILTLSYTCWPTVKEMSLSQTEEKVQCFKHPWTKQRTTVDCKYKLSCRNCGSADHHRVLCPKIVHATTKVGQAALDHEENYSELPPVLLPVLYVKGIKGNDVARRQVEVCARSPP